MNYVFLVHWSGGRIVCFRGGCEGDLHFANSRYG